MQCIKSVRYQAILNGELTERFSPSVGIRQGDPLAPYIFVLCMEKLSHIINDHVSSGTWKSVKVARNGPAISHLFFADDLILFGEASIHQAKLMKHCLDLFCGASGQQVNFVKSRICCSPNTYAVIVDKVQCRLASWESHTLSMASRLTYLHDVTSAIPIYTMQTVDLPMSTCNQLDKLNRNFLWGYTELWWSRRKKTHCMNQALLAKTGWKIVQKDQGLWSQVLNGLKWRVGNGDNILFWKDNWAGCGPLENFATISLSDDLLEWTVSDFLTEQGWNTNWLLGCLPLDVLTSNGEFSVKTAYLSLFTEETNHSRNWDTIWKLHVPPKIKTFVWLLFHGKLLTNVQRVRRNLASNPNCPCCNVTTESLDHLFRRCSHAARMWNYIGIPNQIAHSFSMDFKDWLFINIKASFSCKQGIPWSSLFLASLWFCWKWRCKKVFDVNFSLPPWPHIPIIQFTREWLVANYSRNYKTSKQILKLHWSPPCASCFKINVDGSCMGEMGSISARGIIRDSTGGWIKGFVTNLGCGKILEAELWGVFRGLLLTWNECITIYMNISKLGMDQLEIFRKPRWEGT
ncbi:unnamed protein product [Prunus armeniaca]